MELEVMKKLLKEHESEHSVFIRQALEGDRYYRNQPDILYEPDKKDDEGNPLRNADNRIPRNFHGLLVNQKATYMFTAPPLFDVGNDAGSDKVMECLGDDYADQCMQLCVNAANASVAWVHYWRDDDGFQWGVIPSEEIIPLWDGSLRKRLLGVVRMYKELDEEDGKTYCVYELWTREYTQAFRRVTDSSVDTGLDYYGMYVDSATGEMIADMKHDWEDVPFIPFFNNNINTNDLVNVKKLIDVYNKVYSGFINDLDDVQELIFILTNYGGTDMNGFLQELKKYKTINIDDQGKLETLNIEIPIEARKEVLESTRKAIFEQGQGFDPQPETFGNQSGVALKFMYAELEMKAGMAEVKFKTGFAKLVRAICRFHNIPCTKIIQTWTRTCIQNDTELATICQQSVGVVSKRTILRNHPFVDDVDEELKQIEQEEEEAAKKAETYMFGNQDDSTDDDDSGKEDKQKKEEQDGEE